MEWLTTHTHTSLSADASHESESTVGHTSVSSADAAAPSFLESGRIFALLFRSSFGRSHLGWFEEGYG